MKGINYSMNQKIPIKYILSAIYFNECNFCVAELFICVLFPQAIYQIH